MTTPKGVDISEMVTNTNRINACIDAVIIPDMDNGVMRMSFLGEALFSMVWAPNCSCLLP